VIRPAHVGLIFSEHREAVGLLDRLEGLIKIKADRVEVCEGGLHGKRLAVCVCPPPAATEATELLIDGHQPRSIIAAGFCTALIAKLGVGEMVLAEEIVSTHAALPALHPAGSAWHSGRLLSTVEVGAGMDERQRLAEQYGACAADMHSFYVADVARQRQLPCAALSVVRRAVGENSPEDVERLHRKLSLSRRAGVWTAMLLKRPGSLKTVWNEKEQDLATADFLADGISELIDRLEGALK
jgi:nucleoside phosphorylase